MRRVITGGPRTGKTTLAGPNAYHTDSLISHLSWSEQSTYIVDNWFTQPGPWVIEGVAAVRALRKYLSTYTDAPCDEVVYRGYACVYLNDAQSRLKQQCDSIWASIRVELADRGVTIA